MTTVGSVREEEEVQRHRPGKERARTPSSSPSQDLHDLPCSAVFRPPLGATVVTEEVMIEDSDDNVDVRQKKWGETSEKRRPP